MFKQLEINPYYFFFNEGGNYSINISQINEKIIICIKWYNIYSKENCLSKEVNLI